MARTWAELTAEETIALEEISQINNEKYVYRNADWDFVWVNWGWWSWDVTWPASSTDNAIAVYNWTTGKIIKDSTITVWSLVPYTGATTDVDLDTFSINAKSLHAKWTWWAWHVWLKHQSADITASASESSIWANASGNPVWKNDWNPIEEIMLKNTPITWATKTKITYDADWLVTAWSDATTADISDSTDKRYVTDAQLTVIGNTSWTNSGNETTTTIWSLINWSTEDTNLVDADMFAIRNSVWWLLEKFSWANMKSNLKTYFDTLYSTITWSQNSVDKRWTTAGTANTYTLTLTPAITSYVAWQTFNVKFHVANTWASTININWLWAKTLVKDVSTALVNGDIPINSIYQLLYDGTNFLIKDIWFAGISTSARLAWALSDETGTWVAVFGTSPTFTTSIIWSATMAVMNTVSTVINAFGAATTLNIGWTPTTAITHTYSGNATATATTKTVNLGTWWAAWSTTNVNIWSANGWTTSITSPTVSLWWTTWASTTGTIELWHATDTTISRSSAWVIAVEWIVVPTISSTSTFTNKAINWVNNTLTNLSINAPQWFLINGQILTSVTSWNLTVAIKTLAWTDPSTSDPVYCRIWNTVRTLTSALSVTTNAWTNWYNSWSTELATQEVDYFVYLTYRTSSANIQLWFSRMSHCKLYSEFSGTSTNEKYAAFSTAPAGTDLVENIGRFNATLSAWAWFTWSIPATSIIINTPIGNTRYLTFVPTVTFIDGTAPATSATLRHRYRIEWDTLIVSCANEYSTAWTGNSTITISLPFSENTIFSTSGLFWYLFIGWWSWYWASNGASAQCRWRLARVIWSSINSNGWILWGQVQI